MHPTQNDSSTQMDPFTNADVGPFKRFVDKCDTFIADTLFTASTLKSMPIVMAGSVLMGRLFSVPAKASATFGLLHYFLTLSEGHFCNLEAKHTYTLLAVILNTGASAVILNLCMKQPVDALTSFCLTVPATGAIFAKYCYFEQARAGKDFLCV